MLNILAVIFVFSVLVIIHELGHFIAARLMGVRVEKFSIGFPPVVYSRKIGQTEFNISAIPLGGYVKMAGFIDESMDTNISGAPDEFNSKPVWRRIVIIVAGVIMNLLLAVSILSILAYTQGDRILPYTTIAQTGQGISQKIGFQPHDKIVDINGVPVQNWNELQELYITQLNSDFYFSVLRGESTVRLNFKKEWFREKGSEQLDLVPLPDARVGELSPQMPAAMAGIQTGDLITRINNQTVSDWEVMTGIIRSHPDDTLQIDWVRGGVAHSAKIKTSGVEEVNADGQSKRVGKIGIGLYYESKDIPVIAAINNGFRNTIGLMQLNLRAFWWVISGTKSANEIIGGPIMIAKMAGEAADAGWIQLWYLIAALSAVLAIFNILPIPALDGGHLFLLLIEGIIRKPIPLKVRARFQQIGMAILFTLIIFILYIDIRRLLI
jgi:regulator of sigma E protease